MRGGDGPERPFGDMCMAPGCARCSTWPTPTATLAVIATGQSGNPASADWSDLLPAWRDGGTVTLGRVAVGPVTRLRLLP